MNIEQVQENTLKMIRNNERYEDLIERLLYYAKENKNYTLMALVGQTLDKIESYDFDEKLKDQQI